MKKRFHTLRLLAAVSGACIATMLTGCQPNGAPRPKEATFDYFLYQGHDSIFQTPIHREREFFNPILSGFYPDPSICRKGNDYYLVNSSFAYFPGIPIHHSTDLVNWTPIGHVLNRPSQLNLDGIRLSGGIYAPDIQYNPHNDTFYLVTTCVDGIGNFLVKTQDPLAGEWSDPIPLPEVGGIDPSIFFDEDGKCYIVNNDAPEGEPAYDGHRAIWIREFDTATDRIAGPAHVIVDGGVDKSQHPIWIEGPHLYRINGRYYLMAAEGGTGTDHSEVIFSATAPGGPYKPCPVNPILTQRDLPADRPHPVTCAGHADLVQTPEGEWYAVFLGCRPYQGNHCHTGRETFLLPVSWQAGQPVILEKGKEIPYVVEKQGLTPTAHNLTGNFTERTDSFTLPLPSQWCFLRTPRKQGWKAQAGKLLLTADSISIRSVASPTFVARRIQHQCFGAETAVTFRADSPQDFAGLVCYQDEKHYIAFGLTQSDGRNLLVLRYTQGAEEQTLHELPWDASQVRLRIVVEKEWCHCYYSAPQEQEWKMFYTGAGTQCLSTHVAGGFTGAMVGLYASSRHLPPEAHP